MIEGGPGASVDGGSAWPSVLVVAAIRNGADHLRGEVSRVREALAPCRSLQWLVFESDSTDDTLGELAALAAEVPDFRYRSFGRLRDSAPIKTERLARCRNAHLEAIATDPAYAAVEYVAVVDLDGVNTLLDKAAVASCWTRDDWDMVAANQRGPYYDVWALRHPYWSPNDCWRDHQFLLDHGLSRARATASAVDRRMLRIDPSEDWIPVQSAFGGFALYRRDVMLKGRYVGLDQFGRKTCEHVAFHQDLVRAGARLFVNPALVNAGWTEHVSRLHPRVRLATGARRLLKWPFRLVRDRYRRGRPVAPQPDE